MSTKRKSTMLRALMSVAFLGLLASQVLLNLHDKQLQKQPPAADGPIVPAITVKDGTHHFKSVAQKLMDDGRILVTDETYGKLYFAEVIAPVMQGDQLDCEFQIKDYQVVEPVTCKRY